MDVNAIVREQKAGKRRRGARLSTKLFGSLEVLELDGNYITAKGVKMLLHAGFMGKGGSINEIDEFIATPNNRGNQNLRRVRELHLQVSGTSLLYTIVVLCNIEWCIRQLWCYSIILYR